MQKSDFKNLNELVSDSFDIQIYKCDVKRIKKFVAKLLKALKPIANISDEGFLVNIKFDCFFTFYVTKNCKNLIITQWGEKKCTIDFTRTLFGVEFNVSDRYDLDIADTPDWFYTGLVLLTRQQEIVKAFEKRVREKQQSLINPC